MATNQKKRAVVSYEKMSKELAAAFVEKYPKGFSDYLPDLTKYNKPDGTPFYAVLIELPEDIYLVKIKVKIDDADDIKNWLEGEEEAEAEEVAGATSEPVDDEGTIPDDNISQYGSDDDPADSGE